MPNFKSHMMPIPSRLLKSFLTAAILCGIVAVWIAFTPAQFGGRASYVMVAGASMEPTLKQGDLVITRVSDRYEIADVVTYMHPDLGPIIHRIVDLENGRFILKGDNNDWYDNYKPQSADVVGKDWIHLRGAANTLEWLRTPGAMVLISVVLASMIFFSLSKSEHSRESGPRLRSLIGSLKIENYMLKNAEGIFMLAGVVLITSLILGSIAFTRPTTRMAADDTLYSHQGAFSYRASPPLGIYNEDELNTGDPVFLTLLDSFDLKFEYVLTSSQPSDIKGEYGMKLVIRDASGWNRIIEIQPPTAFSGDEVTIHGTIDLGEVQQIITDLEMKTGLKRSFYLLDVNPQIAIRGKVGAKVLQDSFAPSLNFQLDEIQLQLLRNDNVAAEEDPLLPTESRMIHRTKMSSNFINILGLKLPIVIARWIAIIGVFASIAAITLLTRQLYEASQSGGLASIESKLGNRIVPLSGSQTFAKSQIIDVESIEALTRVADKHDGLIFYTESKGNLLFYLPINGITYRFSMGSQSSDAKTDDMSQTTNSRTNRGNQDES
ncbi:MAG: signal peptidase I [Anaerolineales bacterium]